MQICAHAHTVMHTRLCTPIKCLWKNISETGDPGCLWGWGPERLQNGRETSLGALWYLLKSEP